MFKVKNTQLAIAILISASFASAGGDHHGGHDPMGEAVKKTSRTVQISMTDTMQYTPNVIHIKRGEAVTLAFKNDGKLKHEAVLGTFPELKQHAEMMKKHPDMEHDDPKSITTKPGETAYINWKFTQPGTFHVGCLVPGHFEAGMRASIVVK